MAVFQESTNQGCEVTIYRQQGSPGGVTLLSGTNKRATVPCLISCHVATSMGGGSSFGFVCKPEVGDAFFDTVVDDDWVDIVLTKNGKRWHVMRGLVEEVRRTTQVAGSGATTTTYTIAGRSWQKILTDTPIYFNIGQGENLLGTLGAQIADGLYGSPQKITANVLKNFVTFFAQVKRGAWAMPLGMFNTQGQFYNTFSVDVSGISKFLPRQTTVQPLQVENGTVWSFAQQYSDPMYTELFCDQIDYTKSLSTRYDSDGTRGLGIADTAMTVVYRDKPFISVDPRNGPLTGMNSPWFALPKMLVDPQSVVALDVGRSGQERFNSFNAYQGLSQVLMNAAPAAGFAPYWSVSDMYTHGLRRLDATSNYSFDPQAGAAIGLNEQDFCIRRKTVLKDWYALNARYLNGTLQLGTGAPHIHIGTRVFVPGSVDANNFTAYVEGVSHTWQIPQGTRTSLTVTRGYRGLDADHLAELQNVAGSNNYTRASFKQAVP